jgi:hypothetical protein
MSVVVRLLPYLLPPPEPDPAAFARISVEFDVPGQTVTKCKE